jgi:hypothetical protein
VPAWVRFFRDGPCLTQRRPCPQPDPVPPTLSDPRETSPPQTSVYLSRGGQSVTSSACHAGTGRPCEASIQQQLFRGVPCRFLQRCCSPGCATARFSTAAEDANARTKKSLVVLAVGTTAALCGAIKSGGSRHARTGRGMSTQRIGSFIRAKRAPHATDVRLLTRACDRGKIHAPRGG